MDLDRFAYLIPFELLADFGGSPGDVPNEEELASLGSPGDVPTRRELEKMRGPEPTPMSDKDRELIRQIINGLPTKKA